MSDTPGDSLVIEGGDARGGRLEVAHRDGETIVALRLDGLTAATTVDLTGATLDGWQRKEVDLGAPPGGLVDLADYLAAHATGWPDEEAWQTRDGRLHLTFTHAGGAVLVAVVLRQYHPVGWIASGRVTMSAAALAGFAGGCRAFLGAPAPP